MITTVTLNPSLDKTVYVPKLVANDTNRVTKVEVDAGGKGINCSRMLAELGAETRAVAFLGGHAGEFIRLVLERSGIAVGYVTASTPTRTCIAVEEASGGSPTTFNERGGPIEHAELVEFLELVKDAARASSFIVFGGSIPLGINPDIYNVLIQIAQNGDARAVLDADGDALIHGLKAKPFMIKPNRDEAEQALGTVFESKGDVARGAMRFAEMGVTLVVISLGKQGAVAAYDDAIYDVVAPQVKAISTIGSGDSLIAGVLSALETGAPIEEALRLGCAAGAATAMSSGVEIGRKSDADALLRQVEVTRLEWTKAS